MNIVPPNGSQSAPMGTPQRPRGGLGGPPKWGRKLALAMSALSELDPGNRGATAYQQDRFSEMDARKQALEAEQRRQAQMAKFMEGLSPQQAQLAQLAPDEFMRAQVEQSFAQPEKPSFADQLAREKFEHERRMDKQELYQSSLPQEPEWRDIATPSGQVGVWQENTKTGAKKRVAAPPSGGITVGADGTVTIGGHGGSASTRQLASNDAALIKEARERADALNPVLNTMYAARAELLGPDGVEGTDDDLDTGSFAKPAQVFRQMLPGEQENEVRYDNFDALSKEFGIEKLAGIGGNDTERELLTAIQTGPNLGAQEGSNLSRVNRQIAVFEFLGESRRNFASRWLANNGTTDPNVPARSGPYAGMTYDEALSVFQRQEAQRQGLLGAAPSGQSAPNSTVGVSEQQGDLSAEEYQELLALRLEVNGG